MRVRPVFDLRSSRVNSSSDPTQMCTLERVFVFQTVTQHTVKTGVAEQDRPCEHQPGNGEQVAQHINSHRNSLMVDQVIGPRAYAGIPQVTKHAQVGSKE